MIETPEHERTTGARPTGTHDETTAAAQVREMFDTIAPRYDTLNHLLSAGIDRYWWTRAARAFRPIIHRPEARILDLCCGTGDMALHLLKHRPKPAGPPFGLSFRSEAEESASLPATTPGAPSLTTASLSFRVGSPNTPKNPVILSGAAHGTIVSGAVEGPVVSDPTIVPILAVDFSHQMLSRGALKFQNLPILPIEADALHLPIASGSLDLVTSAFGFRNLANYEEGLAELFRVLRPGGEIGILDCNQPSGLVGALYSLYFKRILPKLGGLLSGDREAYSYLPASVARFPRPPRMLQLIRASGFTGASWTSYTLGTAGLYQATKR